MLSLTGGLEAGGGDRAPDCTNSVTFGGFPFGGLYNKDYSMLGSILGSAIQGNYHVPFSVQHCLFGFIGLNERENYVACSQNDGPRLVIDYIVRHRIFRGTPNGTLILGTAHLGVMTMTESDHNFITFGPTSAFKYLGCSQST